MVPPGTETPFDLSQPAAQVLVVVFFLVPGLNCTWTIERLAGRATLSSGERLLRAVGWSVLIYAMASPWIVRVARDLSHGGPAPVAELILGGSVLVFVAPVGLALLMLLARRRLAGLVMRRLTRIHPQPTPWDFAFREGGPFFVRMELKDGRLIGGYFGDRSVASSYPEAEDLFLEEAWGVAPDGSFDEAVAGSLGMLVSREEISVLELLDAAGEDEDAEQA